MRSVGLAATYVVAEDTTRNQEAGPGRASLNLFHAALTQTQNGPLEVFTEIKQVTVIVSPA